MRNFSGGIPKGRAMRASVATAIGVEKIDGVRRVLEDQYDDTLYVQCTPAAWAEIQALAAKHTGVEHTGAIHRNWPRSQVEKALRVVCAWCKRLMSEGVEPISHGICDSCTGKVFPDAADDFTFVVTVTQGSDDVWRVALTLDTSGDPFISFPAESFLHALRIERFLHVNAQKTAELLLSGHAARVRDVQYAVQMGTISNGTTTAHKRWMEKHVWPEGQS